MTQIFTGRTDAEAAAPILWPQEAKSQLIRKDPDAGKDWRQEEKGMTEEMVGRHNRLNQWTWVWASSRKWWRTGKPGCCSPWGHKESDTTYLLNNSKLLQVLLAPESNSHYQNGIIQLSLYFCREGPHFLILLPWSSKNKSPPFLPCYIIQRYICTCQT